MKVLLGLKAAVILLVASSIAGWTTNGIYIFRHFSDITPEFWVAALGIPVFPLGALHGIYLWF